MNFNKVILCGRLVEAPELQFSPKGLPRLHFALAVNDRFKNTKGKEVEETNLLKVTAWGQQAETIAKYLDKGSPLLVEGRLNGDGVVVLRRFQFVGGQPPPEEE